MAASPPFPALTRKARTLLAVFQAAARTRVPSYPGDWHELTYHDWLSLSRKYSPDQGTRPVQALGTVKKYLQHLADSGELERAQLNPDPMIRTYAYRLPPEKTTH